MYTLTAVFIVAGQQAQRTARSTLSDARAGRHRSVATKQRRRVCRPHARFSALGELEEGGHGKHAGCAREKEAQGERRCSSLSLSRLDLCGSTQPKQLSTTRARSCDAALETTGDQIGMRFAHMRTKARPICRDDLQQGLVRGGASLQLHDGGNRPQLVVGLRSCL